jgi:hypothetical protein
MKILALLSVRRRRLASREFYPAIEQDGSTDSDFRKGHGMTGCPRPGSDDSIYTRHAQAHHLESEEIERNLNPPRGCHDQTIAVFGYSDRHAPEGDASVVERRRLC